MTRIENKYYGLGDLSLATQEFSIKITSLDSYAKRYSINYGIFQLL